MPNVSPRSFTVAENRKKPVFWTKSEKNVRKSRSDRQNKYDRYTRTFKEAFLLKLKHSIFGCYIDIFNPQQNQDSYTNANKLVITQWEQKSYKSEDFVRFEKNNDFVDNGFDYLRKLISEDKPVKLEYLMETNKFLRLEAIYITDIDASLYRFKNLQILSLPGNNIRKISGSLLPRKLKFLELYDNFIDNITELTHKPPNSILHIGLARNCLNDGSCLHLLVESGNFQQLQSLDISENEIYDLKSVTTSIIDLKKLSSLQLEGNPCYVQQNYKQCVLRALPKLQYLDITEILPTDINDDETINNPNTPQLIFYCYRILALQRPPNDKKYLETIHVELNLSLLETDDQYGQHDKVSRTDLQSIKSIKSNTKSAKGVAKKKSRKSKSPYSRPNEVYDKFCFKTERKPWSSCIEFEPIVIFSSRDDLTEIRDSFKTCVPVRIVYLKTQQVSPKKTGKTLRERSDSQAENSPIEKIVKRITLASFNCNLAYPNWSDEAVDFYWADHPKVGKIAVKVEGCLKDLEFQKSKRRLSTKKGSLDRTVLYPDIFTCQVGFGIKRS